MQVERNPATVEVALYEFQTATGPNGLLAEAQIHCGPVNNVPERANVLRPPVLIP